MVGYADFAGASHKIANPQYAAQVAKLQHLKSILDNNYKWSHREIKDFLINVIIAFASIEGTAGASGLGIDFNDPSSWEKLNNNNNGGGNQDNNGGGNNNGSSNTQKPITEEDLLKLLEEHVKKYVNIDVGKIVAEVQKELVDSQLFKDLTKQLLEEGTQALIAAAMADEEQKRIDADAQVLQKTAEKIAKEAKDRADALANETAARARQFAEEATARTNEILEESKKRIAADEAEIQARKDAINKETKARTDAIKKESNDRVEAIRTAAETAQNNLIAESKKLGTKITNLESVTATQAQQISTISTSNRRDIAAAIQEEKTARIAADDAEARARQTLATQLRDDIAAGISTERSARTSDKAAQATINTNLSAKLRDVESAITSEQSARATADEAQTTLINKATSRIGAVESNITSIERTVADNKQALSTKIEGLQSKFGSIDVGGRNLLIGTKKKIIESSGNSNTENVYYDFSPNVDIETIKDFTVSCEIDIKNAQFQSGTTNGRVGVEIQLIYTDNSVEFKNIWFSDLETPKTAKQKLKLTSAVNENKTIREIRGVIQVRNVSSTSVKVYNAKLEKGNIATDWTEAPEDTGAKINEVSAKVDTVKETLADADNALAQRIDTLNSTFNANKSDIDHKYQTLADKDTTLASQLETLKTSVNNNSAAIQEEKTARTNKDDAIATQITGLTTKFNQSSAKITSELKTLSDADSAITLKIDQLKSRTDKAESDITKEQTARTTADEAMTARIDTLNSAHENTKASVTTLANTVATNKEATATELKKVNTKVKDAETAISAETTARTREDEALGTRIDTVQLNLNKASAAITNEAQTRASKDEANAGAIRVVQSNLDTTNANLVQEQKTRASKDEALTSSLNALTTRMGNAEGRITTEEQTRATKDEALTQKLTQLTSNFNQANSAITTLQDTVSRQDTARAQEISTLSAKLGDMRIGGRNYLRETGNLLDTTMWHFVKHNLQTQNEVTRQRDTLTLTAATEHWTNYSQRSTDNPLINFNSDEVVTVSFEANASVTTANFIKFFFRQYYNGGATNVTKQFTPTEANKWFKYSYTFVVPQKHANFTQFVTIFEIASVGTLKLRKMKIERGNVATDWTEAPEDITRLNESTEAKLEAYKSAQATKDKGQTDLLNTAVSRIGTAEGKITNLETTRANKNEVAALARSTLKAEWDKAANDAARSAIDSFKVTYANDRTATASSVDRVRSDLTTKIDNISVGGRNLLLKSNKHYSSTNYGADVYEITEAPAVDDDIVVTMWGSLGADRTGIGVYNSRGYNEIVRLEKISDGVYRGVGKWKHPNGGTGAVDKTLNLYFYPNTATSTNTITKIKLEKGTVGTDWTPAPEDNRDSFTGTNILPNSDFASDYAGWSMLGWNAVNGLNCGFNLEAGPNGKYKYNLKDGKVFWVRDRRTTTAAFNQTLAQNSGSRFSVVPGDILQASVYVAGWGMKEPAMVYLDFYDLAGRFVSIPADDQYNANRAVTVTLEGMRNDGAYTSLDKFHRIFQNVIVPPGAVYGQISIRFRFNPNSDCYGFFVQPQVCQISSLKMNSATPYQISTNGLSAQIVETKTTAANIDGKVNSMYTLKVESAANGKKVISGLMLGTNENESQFGVVADKFFIGNTQNGSIVAPFIVKTVGSQAKVVLKGDLIADGEILGKHIAAEQTIVAPSIIGGSLNIGNRFKVMTNGDVLIQAATGNTGMKITSERIDVYDTSGRLRVRMGKLT